MVQKAVRSEASSPNSLGPKRDWPEVRGEEYRPRIVLSWLLAKWNMGESEEAGCRTLSSHGPENPEEKEIALSLRKWVPLALGRNRNKMKQKILLLALHRGKERRCSHRLLRKSKLQHLRVARIRAVLSTSWTTWGLAGMRGAPLSCERLDAPAYVSIQPWGGTALEDAGGRPRRRADWGLAPGAAVDGASHQGRMYWIASVCCCTAENCCAKPSTVSPNSPAWEMGASRKRALSTSFISARLSQRWRSWTTMVDIAFPRDRAVTFVARRAGPQSCESGCQLKGFGRQTRTVPPSGGILWAQVHRDRSLHLGNARVPPGHSAVEGSEDGGGRRAASGRERGRPRLRQLLMHLREERHWGQSAVVSRAPLRETNRPAARARDWADCWPPARYSRLPGQAWPSAPGPVRRWRQHPRGQPHRTFILRGLWTHPSMLRSTSYTQMAHRMKCWAPRGTDQRNHPAPDRMFAAWVVRGPWGCTRRRGFYSNPQISQSVSRRSSARARETSMGGGRGCQFFHKGKARSQRNHAHTPTTGAWIIHERIFSMLEAQTLKTTMVSVIRRQKTTATKRTRTKRHLEKDTIVRDLLF